MKPAVGRATVVCHITGVSCRRECVEGFVLPLAVYIGWADSCQRNRQGLPQTLKGGHHQKVRQPVSILQDGGQKCRADVGDKAQG